MKKFFIKLNTLKNKLVSLNERKTIRLKELNSNNSFGIRLKFYTGKIVIAILTITVGLINVLTAGLSLTLSGGNWNVGTMASGGTVQTSGTQWTVTGASDGKEDVDIAVSNAGSWSPDSAGAAGSLNKFALRMNNASGAIITGSDTRIQSSLDVNGSFNFGLWFKSPPLGSEAGSHTLTVTLTAKNFVSWCVGGYMYGGYCWFPGNSHDSHHYSYCNWICHHQYSKTCSDGNYHYRHDSGVNCHVAQHYYGGHHCYTHYQSWCHVSAALCWHHHHWICSYSQSADHERCGHGGSSSQWARRVCSCTY